MDIKYPDISVQLTGQDGNGFVIVSRISTALRRAGVDREEIEAFRTEATSGDYNHLLTTAMRWVDVS